MFQHHEELGPAGYDDMDDACSFMAMKASEGSSTEEISESEVVEALMARKALKGKKDKPARAVESTQARNIKKQPLVRNIGPTENESIKKPAAFLSYVLFITLYMPKLLCGLAGQAYGATISLVRSKILGIPAVQKRRSSLRSGKSHVKKVHFAMERNVVNIVNYFEAKAGEGPACTGAEFLSGHAHSGRPRTTKEVFAQEAANVERAKIEIERLKSEIRGKTLKVLENNNGCVTMTQLVTEQEEIIMLASDLAALQGASLRRGKVARALASCSNAQWTLDDTVRTELRILLQ